MQKVASYVAASHRSAPTNLVFCSGLSYSKTITVNLLLLKSLAPVLYIFTNENSTELAFTVLYTCYQRSSCPSSSVFEEKILSLLCMELTNRRKPPIFKKSFLINRIDWLGND